MMRQEFAVMPMRMLVLGPNVREKPGNLDQLADSIRQHGVIEPIICCPHSEEVERFEVLMGQRRFLAARKAGVTKIPALVRPKPTEHERVLLQIAENFERDDMSPIDEGQAFRTLLRGGMTQQALVKTLHRSVGYINERLKILDLPSIVQGAIHVGMVTVKCALSIPAYLFAADDQKGLKRALVDGDTALRDWVADQLRLLGKAPTSSKAMGLKQQFNAQIDAGILRRVKQAAAAENMVLADWVEIVLSEAAEHVLRKATA